MANRIESTTNDYNEANDVKIGKPNPDFIYGIRNNLPIKDLTLMYCCRASKATRLFNGGGQYMSSSGSNGFDNQTLDQLTHGKSPAILPWFRRQDYFFQMAQTIPAAIFPAAPIMRLKAVTLGYNLSKTVLAKLHLDRVRIYARAQNLIYYYKVQGMGSRSECRLPGKQYKPGRGFLFCAATKNDCLRRKHRSLILSIKLIHHET